MNYSKHVKSINGATKPNIEYRDFSTANAQASRCVSPIDVRVSLPAASCVETHENQGSEDRPSISSAIQVSKVTSLKSQHDNNTELPIELDHTLRTSILVLVQYSAPHAPVSSLASTDKTGLMLRQYKIVSRDVLSLDFVNIGFASKPERTERSCSTATNVSGQVWCDQARIDVDGEHLIGQ